MLDQVRVTLPDERAGHTHKFNVGGTEGYLIFGLDDDSKPMELFIKLNKTGTAEWSLYAIIGRLISHLLQCGCPVDTVVGIMRFSSYEPSGITSNANIRFAKSILDYIARYMEMRWCNDDNTAKN